MATKAVVPFDEEGNNSTQSLVEKLGWSHEATSPPIRSQVVDLKPRRLTFSDLPNDVLFEIFLQLDGTLEIEAWSQVSVATRAIYQDLYCRAQWFKAKYGPLTALQDVCPEEPIQNVPTVEERHARWRAYLLSCPQRVRTARTDLQKGQEWIDQLTNYITTTYLPKTTYVPTRDIAPLDAGFTFTTLRFSNLLPRSSAPWAAERSPWYHQSFSDWLASSQRGKALIPSKVEDDKLIDHRFRMLDTNEMIELHAQLAVRNAGSPNVDPNLVVPFKGVKVFLAGHLSAELLWLIPRTTTGAT